MCYQAADESHWRQLYNKVEELLYPGDSSYESNTGGSVVNLRNSTTLEKIKK